MDVRKLINSLNDKEKEKALIELREWSNTRDKKWARVWIGSNRDTEKYHTLVNIVKSQGILKSISKIRLETNVTLSQARALSELIRSN